MFEQNGNDEIPFWAHGGDVERSGGRRRARVDFRAELDKNFRALGPSHPSDFVQTDFGLIGISPGLEWSRCGWVGDKVIRVATGFEKFAKHLRISVRNDGTDVVPAFK